MSTSVSSRPSTPANPTRQQLEELDALLQRMLELPVRKGDGEKEAPTRSQLDREGRDLEHHPAAKERSRHAPEAKAHSSAHAGEHSEKSRLRYTAPETDSQEREEEAPPPQTPDFRKSNHDDWVNLAATWQPSPETWGPLAETWKQSAKAPPANRAPAPYAQPEDKRLPLEEKPHVPVFEPPARPEPIPEPRPAPTFVPTSTTTETRDERNPKSSLPLVLMPLAGFNLLFDMMLVPFGPLGAWLKRRAGRNFLGWVGVLCVVAACGWLAADDFGVLADVQTWLADRFGWTR